MDKDFQRDEWLKNCRIFQNKSSQFTKYVFYINTADFWSIMAIFRSTLLRHAKFVMVRYGFHRISKLLFMDSFKIVPSSCRKWMELLILFWVFSFSAVCKLCNKLVVSLHQCVVLIDPFRTNTGKCSFPIFGKLWDSFAVLGKFRQFSTSFPILGKHWFAFFVRDKSQVIYRNTFG